ncbi:MAG: DUF370 domain-containing protein [Clostridiales bacterium]|nr:DUF370 domain-containing protein [Clostridiales bacterium]
MRFVDLGAGNLAAADRIICIAASDSSPIRRIMQDAKDRGVFVDCCAGKKCRSIIVTDSDHVIASSLLTEDLRKELAE